MTKKNAKKAGPPTKFDKIRRQQIIKAFENGATHVLAAKAAGVSYETLRNWLRRGREQPRGAYNNFRLAVDRAKARGALSCLGVIQGAAKAGDWKPAAWLLERRWAYTKDGLQKEEVPERETIIEQLEPKEIIWDQLTDLKKGMIEAQKSGSYQAFAALQRAFMNTYKEYQELLKETEDIDKLDAMPDEELIQQITDVYVTLPPLVQDKILDKISNINNIIHLKR